MQLETVHPSRTQVEEAIMLLPHGAVVALVNARSFHLFRNAGNEAAPQLEEMPVPRLDTHNHSQGGHHAGGDHDIALASEEVHAAAAIEWLNREALARRIVALVVIAAPRTLGDLRRHYHKVLERALLREVAKDLAIATPETVLAALRGH